MEELNSVGMGSARAPMYGTAVLIILTNFATVPSFVSGKSSVSFLLDSPFAVALVKFQQRLWNRFCLDCDDAPFREFHTRLVASVVEPSNFISSRVAYFWPASGAFFLLTFALNVALPRNCGSEGTARF